MPRPFFFPFLPLYVSLSWSCPRTVHMSVLHNATIHISSSPLPPASPALLFPEARLRPSLLERSLTTGCQAIARVGSLDHIAIPSAMRRFVRGHIPGRLAGIGEIGFRWPPVVDSFNYSGVKRLTQVPRISNARIRKVVGCVTFFA
jgi:hypothetical protein